MAIAINTQELTIVLDVTPSWQNIMLTGKHGIGKSQILTAYYEAKDMKVKTLFLGQMSDPGDLLGLPTKEEKTGRTTFMSPYWFPLDKKPIVLFLDELNRARPEILQTVMDLVLNRKLAGRPLPEGSRIISACNDGDEYQLTDLDPALVSRFNIYTFRPSEKEWLQWAENTGLDRRVIRFISTHPDMLDCYSDKGEDEGLEKSPDRRAWEKVARLLENVAKPTAIHQKIVAGIVGVRAASMLFVSMKDDGLQPEDVLTDFKKVKKHLEKYQLHEFSQLNDAIARLFEANKVSALDHDAVNKNLRAYHDFLLEKNHEAYAHFVSLLDGTTYKQMLIWLSKELPDTYKKVITFIRQL